VTDQERIIIALRDATEIIVIILNPDRAMLKRPQPTNRGAGYAGTGGGAGAVEGTAGGEIEWQEGRRYADRIV